jgi:hypothetical protein
MALTGFPFPYDLNNLLSGAVRVLHAPSTTAVPVDASDIFALVSPYAPLTGWKDIGATRENFAYSRGFDTSGLEIQQVAGNILEEITTITRSLNFSQAEFAPENFQLMEGAPSIATIAASSGQSAQKKVSFGSFSSLARERFAFVSMRPRAAGDVTEPGGLKRGRFVVGVAYSAQMAANEISMEQGKGALTAVELSFTLFPESGQPSGQDWGCWITEDAGTIA